MTKPLLDLPSLRAGLIGIDPGKENAEIKAWVDLHTPTREHFAKVITI